MMIVIAAASVLAGSIQTVTGFGAAVLLMLVIPYFFDMVTAPAVSSVIAMGLSITLVWKFRKQIQWKVCLLPTAIYLVLSVMAINVAKDLNLSYLSLAFSVFLIVLALFFFCLSEKLSMQANWKTASVCAAISGITSGLFSIGGPLMAMYFVSAIKEKEDYIGTLQFLFATANIVNLITRIAKGIFTVDLIPVALVGFCGINAGKLIGLKILGKIDPKKTKKVVYAFVGLSGLLSLIQQV